MKMMDIFIVGSYNDHSRATIRSRVREIQELIYAILERDNN
jgi:hypothetical protein